MTACSVMVAYKETQNGILHATVASARATELEYMFKLSLIGRV